MRYLKIILLAICAYQVNANIYQESENYSTVPKYIGSLIHAAKIKDPSRNHDVVFIQCFKGMTTNEIFDEIIKEISQEEPNNPYTVHTKTSPLNHPSVSTASFIIIICDNTYRLFDIPMYDIFPTYWPYSSKFIFIPKDISSPNDIQRAFKFSKYFGLTNAILICHRKNLEVYSSNDFVLNGTSFRITKNMSDLEEVFPDKFKDMRSYPYRLALWRERPKINFNGRKIDSVIIELMMIIVKRQNAHLRLSYVLNDPSGLHNLFNQKLIDVSLNTGFAPNDGRKVLDVITNFEENGYCALVPIPTRLSFLHYLLSPYDELSWAFMFISIAICGFVWIKLKTSAAYSDSAWYFMFGAIANFLGQSIPFRASR